MKIKIMNNKNGIHDHMEKNTKNGDSESESWKEKKREIKYLKQANWEKRLMAYENRIVIDKKEDV